MKKLKWRVVYGYDTNEYIQVGEEHLEKAKYAMITGKVFSVNGRMLKGSEIKLIEPDVRHYTGWHDTYQYGTGEDYAQIQRDCPMEELTARYELADNRVRFAINNGKEELLFTDPKKLLE